MQKKIFNQSSVMLAAIARLSGGNIWAVEASALQGVRSSICASISAFRNGGGESGSHRYDPMATQVDMLPNGIAVVGVHGMIMRNPDWYEMMFGGGFVDPDRLAETVTELSNDNSVKGILLNIDSPGGEVAGMLACGEAIYQARSKKPIDSWTPYTMASAAYAFGSACRNVRCVPDARVGSVGVIYTNYDFSPGNDGFVTISEFVSGKWKAIGSGNHPMEDEERAKIQEHVDKAAGIFFGMVAKYRGLSPDYIRALDADIFNGEDAIKNNLSDGFAGSLDEAIAIMANEIGPSNQEDSAMAVNMENIRKKYPNITKASLADIANMVLKGQDEDAPKTEEECKTAGKYWYDDACHNEQKPAENQDGGSGASPAPEAAEKPSFTDQASCEGAGHTWKEGKCWEKMTEETTTTKIEYGTEAENRIRNLEATTRNLKATVQRMNSEAVEAIWSELFSQAPSMNDDQRSDMKMLVCPKNHTFEGILNSQSFRASASAKIESFFGTMANGFDGGSVNLNAGVSEAKGKEYYKEKINRLKNSMGR